jgi:hypothetical protein
MIVTTLFHDHVIVQAEAAMHFSRRRIPSRSRLAGFAAILAGPLAAALLGGVAVIVVRLAWVGAWRMRPDVPRG